MLKKLLPKGGFVRNVLTLMTGTTIAQAIPIAISPILTRMYTPEDFGVFALYMAIVSILSVVATGRYELAIMLPEKDEDAVNILSLILIITISISVVLFLVILIFNIEIGTLLNSTNIVPWLFIVPLSLLIIGNYQSINYWMNRQKRFNQMSRNRIFQSSMVGSSNIGMGLLSKGINGLIVGQLLGQLSALLRYAVIFFKSYPIQSYAIKLSSIREIAKRYKHFPIYLVPAHLFNVGSMHLPIILFTSFYSSSLVGMYALTERVLRMPTAVISSAIGDVFRQRAADSIKSIGECRSVYIKTFFLLLIIAIIPFSILWFIAPGLFAFVFGEEWRMAGEYAKIIILMVFLQFIASPLSNMYILRERTLLDLFWQIGLFSTTIGTILLSKLLLADFKTTILFFSLVYSFMYIVNLFFSYRFSNKSK